MRTSGRSEAPAAPCNWIHLYDPNINHFLYFFPPTVMIKTSQPIIPALFFFLHFTDAVFIVLTVLVLDVMWIRIVSQHFVSLPLSRLGDNIAHLKWISAPLFGLMLWVEGYAAIAVIAGSWPIVLINILFALHRFWPDGALDHTQRMFRADADRKRVR